MKYAQWIRDFLSTLFGSKLVVELRAELAEARRERDYFRGQLERANLIAYPQRPTAATRPDWRQTDPAGATAVGGRKTWSMIQAENTKKIAQELAEAVKKKETPN
jgi:hypothetical protein